MAPREEKDDSHTDIMFSYPVTTAPVPPACKRGYKGGLGLGECVCLGRGALREEFFLDVGKVEGYSRD